MTLVQKLASWLGVKSARGVLAPAKPDAKPDQTSPPPVVDPLASLQQIGESLKTHRPASIAEVALPPLQALCQMGDEETAFRWARSLLAAVPRDFALAEWLSQTLCKKGRYAESVSPLGQAVALAPWDKKANLLSLQAEVYESLGDLQGARQALAALVLLDIQYPEAEARLRKLLGSHGGPLGTGSPPGAGPPNEVAAVLPTLADALPDRYELLEELGVGRTGAVYRALDRELSLQVALKVFHPHVRVLGTDTDDASLRALHEARLAAAARHPGVVAVYAWGTRPRNHKPAALPFLVMELCRGGSLRRRVGPLSPAAVKARLGELFDTLAAIHDQGIAHGDLKPENLLFRGDDRYRVELERAPEERAFGDLVIGDFGLARFTGVAFSALGQGTRDYQSLERRLGGPPTPEADLYSVGVIWLELILWPALFEEARQLVQLHATHRHGFAQVLSGNRAWSEQVRAALPLEVSSLLWALLSDDPKNRPSARVCLTELQKIL